MAPFVPPIANKIIKLKKKLSSNDAMKNILITLHEFRFDISGFADVLKKKSKGHSNLKTLLSVEFKLSMSIASEVSICATPNESEALFVFCSLCKVLARELNYKPLLEMKIKRIGGLGKKKIALIYNASINMLFWLKSNLLLEHLEDGLDSEDLEHLEDRLDLEDLEHLENLEEMEHLEDDGEDLVLENDEDLA